MKTFRSKIVNIAFVLVLFLVSSASIVFGEQATEKTQLLVLALEEIEALIQEEILEIEEINHAMIAYEALGTTDEAKEAKYNIREEIIMLKEKTSIPRWEELTEKFLNVEKIIGSNVYNFDLLREELELAKEEAADVAQIMRDINADAMMFHAMNFKRMKDEAQNEEESFEAAMRRLEETCTDGEHGRNCYKQLMDERDLNTMKRLNDHSAALSASNLSLATHIAQVRKRVFAAIAAARVVGTTEMNEAGDNFQNIQLTPKVHTR